MAVNPSAGDLNLWHAYLAQLKTFFPFADDSASATSSAPPSASSPASSSAPAPPSAPPPAPPSRIYVAPLTSVGISIGQTIDPSIVNHDIFRLGDLLLPPESPVFLPGGSYSQRLLRYLQAAAVTPGTQDPAAAAALAAANAQLAAETTSFLDARQAAFRAYQHDPDFSTTSFADWVAQYYPPYQLAKSRLDAASQRAFEASETYYGPQTDDLWAHKAIVRRAFAEKPNPPYNMPTSTAQVTQSQVIGQPSPPVKPEDIKYEPRYDIDATFTNLVTNWVTNAHNPHNAPFVLTFSASGSSQDHDGCNHFADVGFPDAHLHLDNPQVTPALPLFTATYGERGDSPRPSLVACIPPTTDTTVTVTITASDAAVFSVTPNASWNIPDVTKIYPLHPAAPPDLAEPLVLVRSLLLAYQVSVTIHTTSTTLYAQMDTGLARVAQLGGSATLLGLHVGPVHAGANASNVIGVDQITRDAKTQTITIPPRDNAQLTLLGLMGSVLGTPRRA